MQDKLIWFCSHLNQSILLNSPDSKLLAMFGSGLQVDWDRRITDNFMKQLNKTILPVQITSISRRL